MPGQARIHLTPWRQAGFTLIELMMVVLIMGMALSFISLAMGRDSSATARVEVQELLRRLDFVSEQALLNNEVVGLFVEPRAVINSTNDQWCYRWQRFRGGSWEAVNETLVEHCLPLELQLELIVENEPYVYDAKLTRQPPVLVFYPSGEATRLELAMFETQGFGQPDPDAIQRIEVDMLGQIRWLNREAELASARQER